MAFIENVTVKDSAGDELEITAAGEAEVHVADGSDVAIGTTTDVAVDTDATGTVSGKLRGLVKLFVNFLSRLPAALGAGGGLKIDGSGTALPITGTVTVTGAGDATAANQTNGNQKTQLVDAAGDVTDVVPLGTQVVTGDKGIVTNAVIHGTPDGGVTFYDAQVKSTGELSVIDANTNSVIGPTTAVAVQGDVDGSVNAKLRGISKYLADLYNQATNYIAVRLVAGNAIIGQAGIDQTTDGTTNKVRATGTFKLSYGSTVALAVTALQSMASSATVGWKSVRTSNLSTLASDYEVFVKLTTANTAPGNDKAMYVFAIPWYTDDGGTTWYAASGGTTTLPSSGDAAYTIATPHNFRLLGVLNYTTQQMVVQDTFLLSNAFGQRMPDGFSICIINYSGAALSTGCIVDVTPINDTIV